MDNPNAFAVADLSIGGEFTIFTAAATKERLLDAIHQSTAPAIEIDLSDVTEIDSAGLQLMIMARREAAHHGRNLHFSGPNDAVLDLIQLCDLGGLLGDLSRPTPTPDFQP